MRRLAAFPMLSLVLGLGLAVASPASAADPGAPTTPVMRALSYASTAAPPAEIVTWKRSTGGTGTVHYLVFRDGVQIGDTTSRTLSDPNPPVGVPLTYAVQAYDDAGNHSDLSAPRTTTLDTQAPSVPQNLRAAKGPWGDELHWDDATDDSGSISYYIIYENGQAMDWVGDSVAYLWLSLGETASFDVVAVDASGNRSGHSAALSVTGTTPPPAAPQAPRGVPAPAPAPAPAAPAASAAAAPAPVADLPIQDVRALFAQPDRAAPTVKLRTRVRRRRLAVTAGATDAGPVAALQVRLDGRVVRRVSGGSLTYGRRVRGARRRHVLLVSATDAAGNVRTLRRTLTF